MGQPLVDKSYTQQPANQKLGHIPGSYGSLPYLGSTLELLKDPYALCLDHYKKYGPLSRISIGGKKGVLVLGPDLAREVYTDKDKNFSSEMGLERLAPFIGDTIIMQDFDDHRISRRLMQTAFKNKAMQGYVDKVNAICAQKVAELSTQKGFAPFFPHAKTMLLDVALQVFLGIEESQEFITMMNKRFVEFVDAFLFIVPWDVPGTAMNRGLKAKKIIEDYVKTLVPQRRDGDGQDILSYFCREKDDNGNFFSEEVIARNFSLLLFGAHDTTTSAITNSLYLLGKHPEWQGRLQAQSHRLGKDTLSYEDLGELSDYTLVFNEVQRLYPSVPMFLRRTVRDCTLAGHHIPAHTIINIIALFDHRMDEWWTNPHDFDPDRFSEGREEHKQHSYIFRPFGGGAHKCIGMHFAQMVYKCFLHQLLNQYQVETPANYNPEWEWFAMPKPKDDVPLAYHELKQ